MTRGLNLTTHGADHAVEPLGRTLSWRTTVACLAGIAAAWIAAGSAGLMVPAPRHALAWLALGVAVLAAWPSKRQALSDRLGVMAALLVAIGMTVPAAAFYNLLAVAIVLAVLARAAEDADRQALSVATLAVFALALYRLACESIPGTWLAADALGEAVGRLAAAVSGKPLWIGATLAGLDFLVLMAALVFGWLVLTAPPRTARAVYAVAGVLLGQLAYLVVLARSNDLAASLPAPSPPPQGDFYTPPDWQWGEAARSLLPWSVPLLAGAVQLLVAGILFRWANWLPASAQTVRQPRSASGGRAAAVSDGETPLLLGIATVALAVAVPLITTYCPGALDLTGRKIVAYEHGHLDWMKPTHDHYGQSSAGMYGMLPELIGSLGGRFARSADLGDQDLSDADLLVVIHPLQALPEEQLGRVWEYVRGGGSLLVVAGPRVRSDLEPPSVNQLLEPTGVQVRFDLAMSETGYWQHACQALAHPTTTGLGDDRCGFGLAIGPSLRVGWPARPLLVGRWGWSDPGSDALATSRYRYDAGERLGDLVLAAEQRIGSGTVVVLADHTALSNEALPQSYRFVGRLLGYLAGQASTPQAAWRQLLGLLACLGLLAIVVWRLDPSLLLTAAAVLAASLAFCRSQGDAAWQVLPRPSPDSTTKIAYVDATHSEAYVDSRWQGNGIAGLSLTLMRNGYLPLILPEFSKQRLERAAIVISIGPSRSFSSQEQQTIREFLERGGTFVCMVGADRAQSVNPMLSQFGFHVPVAPVSARDEATEPIPLGCVRGPYVPDGRSKAEVNFYAAWPLECARQDIPIMIEGPGRLPILAVRNVGRGKFVLIGDTEFALNKNLETTEGAEVWGPAKNVDFWRWFLARLGHQPSWIPPDPRTEERPAADAASSQTEPSVQDAQEETAR